MGPGHRVGVIGSGPSGIEATRVLTKMGFSVTCYEAGQHVASGLNAYRHVKMFTPWHINVSEDALEDLEEAGGSVDVNQAETPLIGDMVDQYLRVLASHPRLAPCFATGQTVIQVGRENALKSDLPRMPQRADSPFRLLIRSAAGVERMTQVDVLIDASGITSRPAWMGKGGIPAPGERLLRADGRVEHHLPDILGTERERFANKRTLIVGAGYSAATAATWLSQLKVEAPETRIDWCIRRQEGPPVRIIPNDSLPDRARMVLEANEAAREGGPITLHKPAWVERAVRTRDGMFEVILSHGKRLLVDEILAMVGYRPDFSVLDGLQLELDFSTGGPRKLAEQLRRQDRHPPEPIGGFRSWKASRSPGGELLMNPEPDLFVIGHKSFGSRPDYLLQSGYLQVNMLANILAWRIKHSRQ